MELKELQETGRLNLSGFIDLNKSVLSEADFNKKYVNGKYEIYTEKSIAEFQKAITNELVKGEMGAEGLKLAKNQLTQLERVEFQKGDVVIGVFVKSITAGSDTVVGKKNDNLEKGMVTDSFGSYSNNKLSFNKTGKQIKDQITTILLPLLEAQKIQLETELTSTAKDIDTEPDSTVSDYEYRGFSKVLPKVARYSWDLCENRWDEVSRSAPALTDEQKAMRVYNEIAQKIVSTMADIQYATLLARNVEDAKKYELTSDQVLALQF